MAVFTGSGVAIVTPFKDDEKQSINYDALAQIIDQQIEGGTDAIIICGSTGEAATMTEREHVEAVRFTADYVKGRIPVIAGTGSNCTATAIELSREAVEAHVDGLLVVTPYYNKGTQNGLVEHYKAIAKEVKGTPILVYNVPGRTGGNILPSTMKRLWEEVDNVVGIKEASGNLSQVVELMSLTDGKIQLFSGNDDQVVPLLSIGGIGVISVVANCAPRIMHDMCQRFFDGDVAGAAELQRRIIPLFEALFVEVNPIPVKKAMNLLGFAAGPLRMPLTEMEPAHTEMLRKAMKDLGLLA